MQRLMELYYDFITHPLFSLGERRLCEIRIGTPVVFHHLQQTSPLVLIVCYYCGIITVTFYAALGSVIHTLHVLNKLTHLQELVIFRPL